MDDLHVLQEISGAPAVEGSSKIERLARAVAEFWAGTTHRGRSMALSSIEAVLLDISDRRNEREPVSHAVHRLNLDVRLLRRQALEVATRLPRACEDADGDRSAWIDRARNVVQELGMPVPHGHTIRSLLQKPRNAEWSRCLEQTATCCGVRCSTIHNAKGGEYAGVCVVVPPEDARSFATELFAAWADRSDHEPKRVVYVGVTRAMRLVALAVPASFLAQCVGILASANVPHLVCGQYSSSDAR